MIQQNWMLHLKMNSNIKLILSFERIIYYVKPSSGIGSPPAIGAPFTLINESLTVISITYAMMLRLEHILITIIITPPSSWPIHLFRLNSVKLISESFLERKWASIMWNKLPSLGIIIYIILKFGGASSTSTNKTRIEYLKLSDDVTHYTCKWNNRYIQINSQILISQGKWIPR